MLHALRGVRVIDLTRILAGPFGTLLLADLGADVIKIERPGEGDDTRRTGPHFVHGESVYFMAANRSKRSVCVDLGAPAGRAVLHDLVAHADVVVENFRPGVAERLGCDYATLSARNAQIVVCGMTAFGRTGPDRDAPAFDLTLQARGGTMGLTGEPGRTPVRMGPPMGDLAGGMFAALSIAAALFDRTRTGRGAFIDLSLLDCQVALLGYAAAFYLNAAQVLGPQGSAHAFAVPYGAFETADRPIVVAVFTDRFWEGFCRAMGESAWASDPRFASNGARHAHRDTLLAEVRERFLRQGADAWLAALRREGVPAEPVQSVDRVFEDPQVLARGMVAEMAHPTAGTVRTAGNPMKLGEGWEREEHIAPPRLGEHTDAVLRDVAGYAPERIAALRASGVVA